MAERRAPPWWALPVALALASAAIVPLLPPYLRFRAQVREAWREDHVQAIAACTKPLPTIVIVGTSLIHYATPDEAAFAPIADAHGLEPVQLCHLQRAGAALPFDDDLVARIVALRPALLLVEGTGLVYGEGRFDLDEFGLVARKYVKDVLKGRTGLDLQKRLRRARDGVTLLRTRTFAMSEDALPADHLARGRRDRAARFTGGVRADLLRLMQACRAVGTRVLVLPPPFAPGGAAVHAVSGRELLDLIATAVPAVEILPCPLAFEREDFIDLRHMSAQGRQRYSAWLAAELARRLP